MVRLLTTRENLHWGIAIDILRAQFQLRSVCPAVLSLLKELPWVRSAGTA